MTRKASSSCLNYVETELEEGSKKNQRIEILHNEQNIKRLISEPNLEIPVPKSVFNVEKQLLIDKVLVEKLVRHTILFLDESNNGLASGVYVEYKGHEFILTVAHMFDDIDEIKATKLFGTKGCYTIGYCAGAVFFPGDRESFKETDYSILVVNDELHGFLHSNEYEPFVIRNGKPKENLNGVYNMLFGFPSSKNKLGTKYQKNNTNALCIDVPADFDILRCETFDEASELCNNEVYAIETMNLKIDSIDSFATTSEIKTCGSEDEEKIHYSRIPNLNGMSGCGVWCFLDYPFSAKRYELIGLFEGRSKGKTRLYSDYLSSVLNTIDYLLDEKSEFLKSMIYSYPPGKNMRIELCILPNNGMT